MMNPLLQELRRVTDQDVELVTMRRVSFRLLPFLFLLYIFCWLDRSNISIAALQMNSELKFSPAAYGFGAGIFFLSYSLFEVPSNLMTAAGWRHSASRFIASVASVSRCYRIQSCAWSP
jgi:ACS family tartrate transporter-like MFS transporter